MSVAYRNVARFLPLPLLAAGVECLWIALRRFDRLGLLDVYHLPENRGLHHKAATGFFLPCAAGLLCMIVAAVLFLRARNQQYNAGSGTITLLKS